MLAKFPKMYYSIYPQDKKAGLVNTFVEKPAEKVKSTIPLKGHKNWIFSIEIQYVPLISGNGWNILWFPTVVRNLNSKRASFPPPVILKNVYTLLRI